MAVGDEAITVERDQPAEGEPGAVDIPFDAIGEARLILTDDLIAAACTVIYDDEFGHMLQGIIGLDEDGLSDGDWSLLHDLVVAILQHRIHMRNAEFGFPLSQDRIGAIFSGDIVPEAFDYGMATQMTVANTV